MNAVTFTYYRQHTLNLYMPSVMTITPDNQSDYRVFGYDISDAASHYC